MTFPLMVSFLVEMSDFFRITWLMLFACLLGHFLLFCCHEFFFQ